MAEREIVSVEWHERDEVIAVTYARDDPDQMIAAQSVAADLAREAGLHPESSPDGIWRWIRDPVRDDERSFTDASR
jgi:hypothetical protein